MNKNIKIVIIIVGLGDYRNAANRLYRQLSNLNLCDDIVVINKKKLLHILEAEFINLNIFNKKLRGYGFWMWKPVIIKHFLDKDFDQIIYLDAGSEIIDEPFTRLYNWFNYCKFNMIVSPSGQKMESYCKRNSIPHFFQEEEWQKIKNLQMFQAGVVFLKNTDEIIKLFSGITSLVKNKRIDLFNDETNLEFNSLQFIEHRHDQSVFNLFMYKTCNLNNIVTLPSTLTPNNQNNGFNSFAPIICIRNINFLSFSQLYAVYDYNNSFPLFLRIISRILIFLFNKLFFLHPILDYIFIKVCLFWTIIFHKKKYKTYTIKLDQYENFDNWLTISDFNHFLLNK